MPYTKQNSNIDCDACFVLTLVSELLFAATFLQLSRNNMSNIFKKVRDKSSSSRPPTPQPQVDRAIESATQILAAVGSPHPIFQRSTSEISPRVSDQPLSPRLLDVTPSDQAEAARSPSSLVTLRERNFWKEAIESLVNEHKSDDWPPKEWKDLEHDGRELLDVVMNAKNRCLKSQWTIQISGRTINLRDCFTKIVGWVQKFAQVGDAAVQFDTTHAALPWAGFRFLLQIAINEVAIYGGMLEGLERISWLMSYISVHECLFRTYYADNSRSTDTSNQFTTDLVSLYKEILRFLEKAFAYYKRNAFKRVVLSVVETDAWISELMATVDNSKARVERYIDLLSKENMHAGLHEILESFQDLEFTKDQIRELHQHMKDDERIQFLQWISKVRYTDHHETNFNDVLAGTGQWLLEDPLFAQWMKSGSILWLHGIPGSGKTKLTSIVINHFQKNQEEHLVAYFYCLRDTARPERAEPEEILRAILKQLVCGIPENRADNPVEKSYSSLKKEAMKRGEEPGPLSLQICVGLLLEITSQYPATIIIDALDECRRDKRHELLKALDRLLQRADNPTRIFVSSRNDEDLVLRMRFRSNIIIEASKNTVDIQRFVHEQVEEAVRDRKLLRGTVEPDLKARIIKELEKGARGMFRWVMLQVAALCDQDEMKTAEDVRDRLGKLPQDLHKLYDEIYERIEKSGPVGLSITRTTLIWLLYAQRQLIANELLAAVSTITRSTSVTSSTVLDLCCNLITLDQKSESFTFAHLSVREFLEKREEYKSSIGHAIIAKFCIECFSFNHPQNTRLLRYASLFWPHHYQNAVEDDCRNKEAFEAARGFFLARNSAEGQLKWYKLGCRAIISLPRGYDLRNRLMDTSFKPLETICVFGFTDLLGHYLEMEGQPFPSDSIELGLLLAIKWKNETTANLLLEKIAELGNTTLDLVIPFLVTMKSDLKETADVMIRRESTLHLGGDARWTLLHWMVIFQYTPGVSYLLEKGAECNKKDADNRTPLHFAAMNGYQNGLLLLLGKGADMDFTDKAGWTPWHWAACMRQELARATLSNWSQDANEESSRSSFLSTLSVGNVCSDNVSTC
ncbi:hypothetical protein CPB86DRAFT_812717 [Serendipita vermifera]|nr:hypothetical protein CPB86DRAFT_812717 [Serendipita vermifera]